MATMTCLKPLGLHPRSPLGALPSYTWPLSQVLRLSRSLPGLSSPPFQAHSVPATNILHTHLGVRWAQTGTRHRSPALKELTVCWGVTDSSDNHRLHAGC